ncbi:hypothetical protein LOTGIDRAFT_205828 [Lottia gigantea]|uniref:Kelch domain-containing protein 3 n=1 Tax=Lottia gigantea TaxID=225164 RepID=V3Z416_LOTGI|nr:hypothetical protein LOTGIDRAFT_205828 [Lottia gigantea]ESO85378.1 hypothetical protein LOTGIDRAFT_205828 [Lottia gigantea]
MPLWTIHLEGGPRRVNHAAVAIGDRIYSFGGYCTGEDYDVTRPMDVHILDTLSLRWKLLPTPDVSSDTPVPYQRYGHTAVTVGDCAYIWGGRNDKDGACNILFCFDSSNLSWSKPTVYGRIPGARDGHSSCLINNKMYIFGGFEEEIDRFNNEIHLFDFENMSWSYVKTCGQPSRWRDFHTAVGIDNIMYIFGGRSDEGGDIFTNHEIYCNKIQTFNTITNTWSQLPVTHGAIPSGRRSHSAFTYQGLMYIFGGYNGIYDQHYNDVYALDPVKMEWMEVKVKGDQPCPRRRQCCCIIGSQVFLFGGTSPKDQHTQRTENDLLDHSDLYALDFSPSLKILCQLAVLKYKLETKCLPADLRWDLTAMTTNNTISRSCNTNG